MLALSLADQISDGQVKHQVPSPAGVSHFAYQRHATLASSHSQSAASSVSNLSAGDISRQSAERALSPSSIAFHRTPTDDHPSPPIPPPSRPERRRGQESHEPRVPTRSTSIIAEDTNFNPTNLRPRTFQQQATAIGDPTNPKPQYNTHYFGQSNAPSLGPRPIVATSPGTRSRTPSPARPRTPPAPVYEARSFALRGRGELVLLLASLGGVAGDQGAEAQAAMALVNMGRSTFTASSPEHGRVRSPSPLLSTRASLSTQRHPAQHLPLAAGRASPLQTVRQPATPSFRTTSLPSRPQTPSNSFSRSPSRPTSPMPRAGTPSSQSRHQTTSTIVPGQHANSVPKALAFPRLPEMPNSRSSSRDSRMSVKSASSQGSRMSTSPARKARAASPGRGYAQGPSAAYAEYSY
ncbi:hypothetical protein P7C70_g4309, partial [Phenoliferia sp. Uapishka_3]